MTNACAEAHEGQVGMNAQDPILTDAADATEDAPAPVSAAVLFFCAIVLGALLGLSAPTSTQWVSNGVDLTLLAMIASSVRGLFT